MPEYLPPFTPWLVSLMGEQNLGIVQARWLGCILELEDGTRHGPCAVFSAAPAKPKPDYSQPRPMPPAVDLYVHNHRFNDDAALQVTAVYEGHVVLDGGFAMTMDEWYAQDAKSVDTIPF